MTLKTIATGLVVVLLATLSWHFGTWVAQPHSPENPTKPPTEAQKNNTLILPNSATTQTQSTPTRLDPKIQATPTTPEAYTLNNPLITQNHLEKRAHDLEKAFSPSETGRAIAEMTLFRPFGPAIGSPESEIVDQKRKILETHPTETLAELTVGLPKLGSDYAQDRQWLMQVGAKLNTDTQSKVDFLTGELQNSVSESNIQGQAAFNAPIALTTLLSVTENYASIEPSVRRSVTTEKNGEMREILLTIYGQKNEEGAQKLRQELGL